MKKSKPIMYFICTLLAFLVLKSAQAQNTRGTSSQSLPVIQVQPLPGRSTSPIIMNNGIVWPLEGLNVFEDSTLGESTLGERIKRKSNIELNKPEGDQEGPQAGEEEVSREVTQTQIEKEAAPGFVPLPPSYQGTIYVWTDKSGVQHFTNNIKSIPSEYRDQVTKISGE